MTALEYMEKQLAKHRLNYIRGYGRGVPEEQLDNIRLKISICESTIDALRMGEVVRCAKCKCWDPDSEYCQFWHGIRHPEHYCGEGDRQ